jgi:Zn-dependent peptidase ImmA (M78 family)
MTEAAPVKPELIRWAIERSRLPLASLQSEFPKVIEWQRGEAAPTHKQLERFAGKTMTPLGYLYLDTPPNEVLPIPDFRTVGDTPIQRPSPNLIDTIQVMQRRQSWMRDYVIEEGQDPLKYVKSEKNSQNPVSLAARIRTTMGLDPDWAESFSAWEDALRALRNAAERIGVLVSTSSFVGLNTHRLLDAQEFRGFVLCDDYAPVVFVNGCDSKSAQMFTIAHELVHLWTGQNGLFNLIKTLPHSDASEQFCNQVAAEFLVPSHKLRAIWNDARKLSKPFHEIARRFKVSPVVAARRALDLGLIRRNDFFSFYERDQAEWHARRAKEKQKEKQGGPNFYALQDARLGKRFAYSVVRAAREGRLPFQDAYRLTDLRGDTFSKYASLLMQRMRDEAF